MTWKYSWLRVQSTATENGRNCFGVSRANAGLCQLKIFLEVVDGFSSIKITSRDTPFLRCFVQSIVQPEQNSLAGQCNEHQKSVLPKPWVGWTVLRPDPARSSPGVCRALENSSLRSVQQSAMRCCLLTDTHPHLGKQGGILKGAFSSHKPLWLTVAFQSHSQMKVSQIQHHFPSSPHHILPSTLNPPASYLGRGSFCLNKRCMWLNLSFLLWQSACTKGLIIWDKKPRISKHDSLSASFYVWIGGRLWDFL